MNIHTMTDAELDAIALNQVATYGPQPVTAIDYGAFLQKSFPPRQTLLAPWLPEQGLAMIHAPRGIGKTHLALGTAWAVAAGGD